MSYRCIVARANTRVTGVRLRSGTRRAVARVTAAAQLIFEPLRRRQSRIVTEMRHSARAVKMRASDALKCLEARFEARVIAAAVSVLDVQLDRHRRSVAKRRVRVQIVFPGRFIPSCSIRPLSLNAASATGTGGPHRGPNRSAHLLFSFHERFVGR